mgnify:CR=1 FL=1
MNQFQDVNYDRESYGIVKSAEEFAAIQEEILDGASFSSQQASFDAQLKTAAAQAPEEKTAEELVIDALMATEEGRETVKQAYAYGWNSAVEEVESSQPQD